MWWIESREKEKLGQVNFIIFFPIAETPSIPTVNSTR